MARIRTIKPEFWSDEKLAGVPRDARLLFAALLNMAEDHGVARGNPAYVRSQAFPYDIDVTVDMVKQWMGALELQSVIRLFEKDGQAYVFIINFTKHQKIDRPARPTLPQPPFDDASTINRRMLDERSTNARRALDDVSSTERKGKEGSGKEGKGEVDLSAEPTQVLPALVLLEEEASPPSATPTPSAANVLREAWNCHSPPLPAWKLTSSTRDKAARARLKEHPEPEFWFDVCRRIAASEFCLGKNDRGWNASPDWLLQPDTAAKVLEGKYDGRKSTTHERVPGVTYAPKADKSLAFGEE